MVDTVKLILDKGMFWITDKNLFVKGITNAGRGYSILVQNPTPSELKSGIYKPRLTLTNRFNTTGKSEETLTVELSLPKLIFGNNFDELKDEDFEKIVEKLRKVLSCMGVKILTNKLREAPVSAIHYSKNIPLTDGSTPHYLISKLYEANISKALDTDRAKYRNEGHGLTIHCNSYEVSFYDKIRDLEAAKSKGDKRSLEEDSAIQLPLLEVFRNRNLFEVLRMEVRLNSRPKIKQLLERLQFKEELNFKGLFQCHISKKVLLHYVNEFEMKRPKIQDLIRKSAYDVIANLKIQNPSISMLKALQVAGAVWFLQESTIRDLRLIYGNRRERAWLKLVSDLRKLEFSTVKSPLKIISEKIEEFIPLKIIDFEDGMLNNDKYK